MKGFDLPVRFTLLGLPAGVCGDTRVSFPGRSPCLAGCVSGAAGGWDVQCHPAAIPSPRALAQPRGMHTIHQPTSYFKLFPKAPPPCAPHASCFQHAPCQPSLHLLLLPCSPQRALSGSSRACESLRKVAYQQQQLVVPAAC